MIELDESIKLSGKKCELILLARNHLDALIESVTDGALWDLWYTTIPSPEAMADEINRRLSLYHQNLMVPFAITAIETGCVVGMTAYLNLDSKNKRMEIGSTWLRQACQRTGINLEAKKLLLEYAFEECHCHAVELRTHVMNTQSRRSIEKLGAKLDGILRNHMVLPNGTLRDTCVYSILESEWPMIKSHLCYLLGDD